MKTANNMPGLGGELILAAAEYSNRDRIPWLAARRSGLGASESATILGLNNWQTPLSIWQEKTSPEPPQEKDIGPKARWGQILEDTVAREVSKTYLAKEGLKIAPTPGLLRHEEHPWLLATLDRVVVPRAAKKDPSAVTILEIKTTGGWNYRTHWIDGIPPAHIQIQVQQQLAVTGLPYALVAVLVDGYDLKEPVRIERDDFVIEQMITYTGAWWNDYMVAGVMPDLTFADHSALSGLYPGDSALPAVVADEEIEKHLGEYMYHRDREKEHKTAKEKSAFEVQTKMGDALTVQDKDGRVRATWKPTVSNNLDGPAFKKAHPDLAKTFTVQRSSRRFIAKEIDA